MKQEAIFAAGCFWGVQYYFDQVPGVIETLAGYTGGHVPSPSYEAVCTGRTGHAEAVQIVFDPSQVSYNMLVRHFFRMHDPTQYNRQGPDVGSEYRSAIFYGDITQKHWAQSVRDEVQQQMKAPIATEIAAKTIFYLAEAYHQKFTERTGRGMCHVPYQPVS